MNEIEERRKTDIHRVMCRLMQLEKFLDDRVDIVLAAQRNIAFLE
jgi:hypothetical protein